MLNKFNFIVKIHKQIVQYGRRLQIKTIPALGVAGNMKITTFLTMILHFYFKLQKVFLHCQLNIEKDSQQRGTPLDTF